MVVVVVVVVVVVMGLERRRIGLLIVVVMILDQLPHADPGKCEGGNGDAEGDGLFLARIGQEAVEQEAEATEATNVW